MDYLVAHQAGRKSGGYKSTLIQSRGLNCGTCIILCSYSYLECKYLPTQREEEETVLLLECHYILKQYQSTEVKAAWKSHHVITAAAAPEDAAGGGGCIDMSSLHHHHQQSRKTGKSR